MEITLPQGWLPAAPSLPAERRGPETGWKWERATVPTWSTPSSQLEEEAQVGCEGSRPEVVPEGEVSLSAPEATGSTGGHSVSLSTTRPLHMTLSPRRARAGTQRKKRTQAAPLGDLQPNERDTIQEAPSLGQRPQPCSRVPSLVSRMAGEDSPSQAGRGEGNVRTWRSSQQAIG